MKNMKKGIICVLVCMLMILCSAIPILATTVTKKTSQPLIRGNILYVGGTGPGNYSTIQEGIDAATLGDTVFVFDDSSPYYENIIIDKPITVIGENRDTTIIDGGMVGDVVKITVNTIDFSGFTVRNSQQPDYYAAIYISASDVTIHDCNIYNSSFGVYMEAAGAHNSISNNHIENNHVGIQAVKRCSILGNILKNNNDGVRAEGRFIEIQQNIFIDNNVGLYLHTPGLFLRIRFGLNRVTNNLFKENKYVGVEVHFSNGNIIKENDFINNYVHADFLFCHWQHWNKNYWFPRPFTNNLCPYVIKSLFFLEHVETTWVNFDWHPAQTPYGIGE
jgi:parallel beta-helix repeat protein